MSISKHQCPNCHQKFSLPNIQKGLSFCPHCGCHLVSPHQNKPIDKFDKRLTSIVIIISAFTAVLAFLLSFYREQEYAVSIINLLKSNNWYIIFGFALFARLADFAVWWHFQRITYYKKGLDSLKVVMNDNCLKYANTTDKLMPKDTLPFTCSECKSQRIKIISNKEYQTSNKYLHGKQENEIGLDDQVSRCENCHTVYKIHKNEFDKSEKKMIIFLGVVIILTTLGIIFSHVVMTAIEWISNSRFLMSIIWAMIGYVAIFAVLPYPAKYAKPKPLHKLIKLT